MWVEGGGGYVTVIKNILVIFNQDSHIISYTDFPGGLQFIDEPAMNCNMYISLNSQPHSFFMFKIL